VHHANVCFDRERAITLANNRLKSRFSLGNREGKEWLAQETRQGERKRTPKQMFEVASVLRGTVTAR
jgi:hypothetical protein